MYSSIYKELKSEKASSKSLDLEDIHRKLNNPSKVLSKVVSTIVLDYCKENQVDHSHYILYNGKSTYITMSSLPPNLKDLLYKLSLHIK